MSFWPTFVPDSDPAYPVIDGDPSRCAGFALVVCAPEGRRGINRSLARLAGKGRRALAAQGRVRAPTGEGSKGPRIAATLGPLGDFESGMTLLFADADASFGILTLLRTSELGPFTSSESASWRCPSTLRRSASLHCAWTLPNPDESSALRRRAAPATQSGPPTPKASSESFYVLDRDLQIVLAWTGEQQRRIALTGLRTTDRGSSARSARRNRPRADRRLAGRLRYAKGRDSASSPVLSRPDTAHVGAGGALHRRAHRPL